MHYKFREIDFHFVSYYLFTFFPQSGGEQKSTQPTPSSSSLQPRSVTAKGLFTFFKFGFFFVKSTVCLHFKIYEDANDDLEKLHHLRLQPEMSRL